jgi:hypothetical protein
MLKKTLLVTALSLALTAGVAHANSKDTTLRGTFDHKGKAPTMHQMPVQHSTYTANPITNTNTNIITINTSATQKLASTTTVPNTQTTAGTSQPSGIDRNKPSRISGPINPTERISGPISPMERTSGPISPMERTSGLTNPTERISGPISPMERISGPISPMERTSGLTNPTERISGLITPMHPTPQFQPTAAAIPLPPNRLRIKLMASRA